MTTGMVTKEHLLEAKKRHGGYCTRGMDLWFRRYGLSLRHFLQNGYEAHVIEQTGDSLGLRVVEIMKEQEAQNGR